MKTSNFDPLSVEIFNRQLKKVTVVVLVVFGLLVLRLWFLQVLNGSTYRVKSENNRIRLEDIPPFRGLLFDYKGGVLVDNRPSYDLYVIPEEVQDRKKLLQTLKDLVNLDPAKVKPKLENLAQASPFRPVCLKKDITRNELAVIETHRFNLSGIMIKVRPQRHYIWGNLASHLLGYLGEIDESQLKSGKYPYNKAGDLIGKSGVELEWQENLTGRRGGEQAEVDAAGRKIRVISKKPPLPGANVYLTIHKELQALAEKALSDKRGAVVALDPNNGKVLALASSPSFNPNLFIQGIDRETWNRIISSKGFPLQNRALSGQYPPGSIFKIVVALAGLEEGLVDPEEEVYCNGVFTLGRGVYHCWKKHGHGMVDLHRALVESCDVYFYKLGIKLGVDKIARYAKRFGLSKPTGFDAGQEKGGFMPTSRWKLKKFGVPWQPGETVSVSIGQSFVLVTPIQMATFISALYNGGTLYKPQVTHYVEKAPGQKAQKFVPRPTGKWDLNPRNMALVKKALVGVVNEPHGTGWRARLKGITVAGKTGTAQVIALEREEDFENEADVPFSMRDHAWFIAVAPADRPRIAVAVVVEHGGHGGKAAAPIAREVVEAYLSKDRPSRPGEKT